MAKKSNIPVHSIRDTTAHGLAIENSADFGETNAYNPHRDEHYIFGLQLKGYSRFMVDFETVEVRGASIICVLPGQVHRLLSSRRAQGWVIAADMSWVSENCRNILESQSLQPLALDATTVRLLAESIRLFAEFFQREGDSPVTRSFADVCTGQFAAAYLAQDQNEQSAPSRLRSITRQFRKMLARDYKTLKSPAAYAAAFNISPAYLNEAVKAETGFPVSYWIHREVVLEASRMLYYTNNSVKEIAYALGYDDPAYFTRLFSKTAGLSPQQFRQQHRE